MAIFSENELIKYNRNGRLIELCVHVDMNYDSLETILNVVEYPARESSMGFCHCLHDAHNTTMPSFFFFYFFFPLYECQCDLESDWLLYDRKNDKKKLETLYLAFIVHATLRTSRVRFNQMLSLMCTYGKSNPIAVLFLYKQTNK